MYPQYAGKVDPWNKAWVYFAIGSLAIGLAAAGYWTYLAGATIDDIFQPTYYTAAEATLS